MSITDRFNKVLATKDFTQKQWAELLGCGRSTITQAAQGLSLPSAKILTPLRALGYSIDWLLSGEGTMNIKGTDLVYVPPEVEQAMQRNTQLEEQTDQLLKEVEALRAQVEDLEGQLRDKTELIAFYRAKYPSPEGK